MIRTRHVILFFSSVTLVIGLVGGVDAKAEKIGAAKM